MNEQTGLSRIGHASKLLAEARTIDDALHVADVAAAAEIWGRRAKLGIEVVNQAAEVRLDAERKAGYFASKLPRSTGGASTHKTNSSDVGQVSEYATMLENTGATRQDVNRWQKLAEIPEAEYKQRKDAVKSSLSRLTTKAVVDPSPTSDPSFDPDSWRTPAEWIERARSVLGEIDLDPASSEAGNELVQAERFFDKETDGLKQEWSGNVFLNPPYSGPLVKRFCDHLVDHLPKINKAVVLLNSDTSTGWFHSLASKCSFMAFPKKRIDFLDGNGDPIKGNRNPQVLFFFHCDDREAVLREFGESCLVVEVVR